MAPDSALAGALLLTAMTGDFGWWLFGSVLLGLCTAMVYPGLIAAVSDASNPSWRARLLGVYRFWRDLGYAIGALSAGLLADAFGFRWAIPAVAAPTFLSGAIVALVMQGRRYAQAVTAATYPIMVDPEQKPRAPNQ